MVSQEQNGLEINVVRAAPLRKGTPKVLGEIAAGDLVHRAFVPRRDHRLQSGYQREVSKSRVNKLSQDLTRKLVDLPTTVLVNLRDYDPDKHIVDRGGASFLCLNEEKLYVVDGQHRVTALASLVEDDPETWANFRISFVCMLGGDELEEMEQFYIVNSTAKSVRTDLALDILKQRAESDPDVMNSLIERGDSWKVTAQTIVEGLVGESPIWDRRVRFGGDPMGVTTVGSSGVVNSLKQLLATPYFGAITTSNQIAILSAYWQGVKQVIPEVFDDPQKYTLQKATGVAAMHTLLITLLELVRSTGQSVVDPDSYADALTDPLLELEGDTRDGEPARGADFWLVGAEGAAGSYSSNAGRRVLVSKLRARLPELEVA